MTHIVKITQCDEVAYGGYRMETVLMERKTRKEEMSLLSDQCEERVQNCVGATKSLRWMVN